MGTIEECQISETEDLRDKFKKIEKEMDSIIKLINDDNINDKEFENLKSEYTNKNIDYHIIKMELSKRLWYNP